MKSTCLSPFFIYGAFKALAFKGWPAEGDGINRNGYTFPTISNNAGPFFIYAIRPVGPWFHQV